jgi:hypothetical protein
MYSSTCFGRPHAHHQELNNCSISLWFYGWSVVVAVLLVVVGPAGRPDHDQLYSCIIYSYYVITVWNRLLSGDQYVVFKYRMQ